LTRLEAREHERLAGNTHLPIRLQQLCNIDVRLVDVKVLIGKHASAEPLIEGATAFGAGDPEIILPALADKNFEEHLRPGCLDGRDRSPRLAGPLEQSHPGSTDTLCWLATVDWTNIVSFDRVLAQGALATFSVIHRDAKNCAASGIRALPERAQHVARSVPALLESGCLERI
jgi:hypothetical protein